MPEDEQRRDGEELFLDRRLTDNLRDLLQTLFVEDTEGAMLDCASRLMQLLDRPDAAPILRPGIVRELHYWLLSGPHGPALRTLVDPDGYAGRLASAIAILRAEYRSRVPVERLAAAAAMSLTAFHKHFKMMTSLTLGQYQKAAASPCGTTPHARGRLLGE